MLIGEVGRAIGSPLARPTSIPHQELKTDLRCNVKNVFHKVATRLEGSEREPTCRGRRMLLCARMSQEG